MFGKAIVVIVLVSCVAGLTCYNEKNQAVDWWVAYKFPSTEEYGYADLNNQWLDLSQYKMKTGYQSALNFTLSQIYGRNIGENVTVVLYNDEPPTEDGVEQVETYYSSPSDNDCTITQKDREYPNPTWPLETAHAKGIVAVDDNGNGFWMIHSTPQYPLPPNATSTFHYMESAQDDNAQNFLCVTFSGWDSFNTIGGQLQYFYPQVYYTNFTKTGQKNLQALYNATVDLWYVAEKATNTVQMKSAGGNVFYHFAKTGYWQKGWDMWDEYVAPTMKLNLTVQTWREGEGCPLNSSCTTQYQVQNVVNMTIDTWNFHYLTDHSKWAVSTAQGTNWYCGADINRMESQGERGGGAMCFQSEELNTSLYEGVSKAEWCPDYADDDSY